MRVPCLKMETDLAVETLCVCLRVCACSRARVCVFENTGNKNPPIHWSPN